MVVRESNDKCYMVDRLGKATVSNDKCYMVVRERNDKCYMVVRESNDKCYMVVRESNDKCLTMLCRLKHDVMRHEHERRVSSVTSLG
jgi:hypothetical protein